MRCSLLENTADGKTTLDLTKILFGAFYMYNIAITNLQTQVELGRATDKTWTPLLDPLLDPSICLVKKMIIN